MEEVFIWVVISFGYVLAGICLVAVFLLKRNYDYIKLSRDGYLDLYDETKSSHEVLLRRNKVLETKVDRLKKEKSDALWENKNDQSNNQKRNNI